MTKAFSSSDNDCSQVGIKAELKIKITLNCPEKERLYLLAFVDIGF
jgi:hypothetical protein